MSQFNDPASQVAAMLGTTPDGISSSKHRAWAIPFDFTNLAAGASTTITIGNDFGRLFVVDYIVGSAWLTNADSPTIAGTPLYENADPSPPATVGNTLNPLNLLSVQFATDANPWSQGPLVWTNAIGTAKYPFAPRFNPVIPSGTNIKVTITNNTVDPVSGEIVLHGRQLAIVK